MPFNDHYSYQEFQFIPALHRLLYNISNSVTGCYDVLTRNHFRNTPFIRHYNKKTLLQRAHHMAQVKLMRLFPVRYVVHMPSEFSATRVENQEKLLLIPVRQLSLSQEPAFSPLCIHPSRPKVGPATHADRVPLSVSIPSSNDYCPASSSLAEK